MAKRSTDAQIVCVACGVPIVPDDAKHEKQIRDAARVNGNGSWCDACAKAEMDRRVRWIDRHNRAARAGRRTAAVRRRARARGAGGG